MVACDIAKHQVSERFRASAARVPGLEDAGDFVGPRHGDGATCFENNNGMRVGGGNLSDQVILMVGQRQRIEVHAFAFPGVGEDDGDIGGLGQGCGGRGIGAGIILNVGGWSLGANRLQG
jgi:hypothetical protein